MLQKQKIVEVKLKDGSRSKGIATGNNAAWMCICGRMEPILGRSGLMVEGVSDGLGIECPDCKRKYFVVPDGKDQASVLNIVEID